jgi:hypothetical protein
MRSCCPKRYSVSVVSSVKQTIRSGYFIAGSRIARSTVNMCQTSPPQAPATYR